MQTRCEYEINFAFTLPSFMVISWLMKFRVSESIQFLHKVADKISSIAIEHENHTNNVYIPHPLYIPIIKSILLRKCQRLVIKDHCRNVIFGATEQQEMLQVEYIFSCLLLTDITDKPNIPEFSRLRV